MSEPVVRATSLSSHPGTPQKAHYEDCPACLQQGVQTRVVEDSRGLHCPDCSWKNYESLVATPAGVIPDSAGTCCSTCGLKLIDEHTIPSGRRCVTCHKLFTWNSMLQRLEPFEEKPALPTFASKMSELFTDCTFEEPEKVVHSTGATRSSEADGWRYDLIPQRGLERVAKTCHEGAVKYTPHNWKKGFAWSVMMAHATKHIAMWLLGDKSEDHLAHACWNLLALMDYEVIHPELNDIPERQNDSTDSTGSSSSTGSQT